MKCYHWYDPKTKQKIHIPYCWPAVIHGENRCTCYEKKEKPVDEKAKYIRELEKRNAELNRIIKKLLKIK